jgi:hypothetical protein
VRQHTVIGKEGTRGKEEKKRRETIKYWKIEFNKRHAFYSDAHISSLFHYICSFLLVFKGSVCAQKAIFARCFILFFG